MTQRTPGNVLSEEERTRLCREAVAAARFAYAPYSGFGVGAEVLGASGAIYRGADIENASYGLSSCAEHMALANVRTAGEREVAAIAVVCVDAEAGSPV